MVKRAGNQSSRAVLTAAFALIVITSAVLLAGCGGGSGSQSSAPVKGTQIHQPMPSGNSSSGRSTSSAPVTDHRTPGDLQVARQLMMLQQAVNACMTNSDAIYEFDFPAGGDEGDLTNYCEKPGNLENEHVCKAGMDCAHGDQETIIQQRTKLVRHGGFNYGHGPGQVYAEITPAENPTPEYSADYTLKGQSTAGPKLKMVGQVSDREGPQGTQLVTDPKGLIYYWIDLGDQVPCLNSGPCVVEPTTVSGNGAVQSYGRYWSAG